MSHTRGTALVVVASCLLWAGGCSTDPTPAPPSAGLTQANSSAPGRSNRYPDVTQVSASRDPDGTWTFDVTMTSPYDTPERYADGWRVSSGDRVVLGEMTLGHDHASEQPFTRTQTGVEIPPDVDSVTVQGRDLVNGYGGAVVSVSLGTKRPQASDLQKPRTDLVSRGGLEPPRPLGH